MNYRICYERGNPKNPPIYEFHKWCKCEKCNIKMTLKIGPPSSLTITTKDLNDKEDIEKYMENWKCNGNDLERVYTTWERGSD